MFPERCSLVQRTAYKPGMRGYAGPCAAARPTAGRPGCRLPGRAHGVRRLEGRAWFGRRRIVRRCTAPGRPQVRLCLDSLRNVVKTRCSRLRGSHRLLPCRSPAVRAFAVGASSLRVRFASATQKRPRTKPRAGGAPPRGEGMEREREYNCRKRLFQPTPSGFRHRLPVLRSGLRHALAYRISGLIVHSRAKDDLTRRAGGDGEEQKTGLPLCPSRHPDDVLLHR
jgi:hypothetical protein